MASTVQDKDRLYRSDSTYALMCGLLQFAEHVSHAECYSQAMGLCRKMEARMVVWMVCQGNLESQLASCIVQTWADINENDIMKGQKHIEFLPLRHMILRQRLICS